MAATHRELIPAIAAAFWLATTPSVAASQQQELPRHEDKITVTASRVPESVLQSGNSVTVVSGAEIEASGARWLSEVLEWVPGVTLARNGGPGNVTGVFLRGTNSNHTLVLIDGVKANQSSTGAYNFAHLPAFQIERVEIVRGPQSTIYGSEAIGGVINVITRRGDGPLTAGIEVDGGSLATRSFGAWINGQHQRLQYSASLGFFDSDSISAADERFENRERDGYRNLSLDARLGLEFDSGMQLETFARVLDADTDIDGFAFGVGPVDDDNFTQSVRDVYAGFRLRQELGPWASSLLLSTTEQQDDSSDPDGEFFLGARLDASIRELDWQNSVSLGEAHTLLGGVEYRQERVDLVSIGSFGDSGYDERIDSLGLYVQERAVLTEDLVLTLGGRYEEHSRFGNRFTYRVSASASVLDGMRLHASAGSGFRAPSLNDLYFPFFGNPSLGAESSRGVDVGVEGYLRDRRLRLDLTYFHTRVDNLIQFSALSGRAENIASASSNGVESTLEWLASDEVRFSSSYTYTDSQDAETELSLLRRPRHQASIRINARPWSRWRLDTELRLKGQRTDFGPLGRVTLDDYALWNVATELDLTSAWSVTARLHNLLNSRYQEVFGYGTLGRSFYTGLRLRLGAAR